jgi:hypothetical protein
MFFLCCIFSSSVEFHRIGLGADELLEIRHKNTLKRLDFKATQEGKLASQSAAGDSLLVDGVLVFSLKDGFIHNGANNSVRPTVSQTNNG